MRFKKFVPSRKWWSQAVHKGIYITRITNPYGHPNILAEFIAGQLKNRASFCKAIKKAIELTKQADTKGIRVQIAGCLDGKEIARVEWTWERRVPPQTNQAKIDYCCICLHMCIISYSSLK